MHIESWTPRGRVRCLDVGGDGTLADAIHACVRRTDWTRLDPRRRRGFGEAAIPYGDGEFDVALLCDTLHSASGDAARLLAEAARVARCVILKDRFDESSYRPYVTRETFVQVAGSQRLLITALDFDLDLGDEPRFTAPSKRNGDFIAVLAAANRSAHAA